MRNLALPSVLLVMGAVAVACDSGPATSPNSEVGVAQLGLTAVAGCPAGFDLSIYAATENIDRNEDGYVCVKIFANGKAVVFDNHVPFQEDGCPAGTTELILPIHDEENPGDGDEAAHAADLNVDGTVCVNGGGNLFTDNGVAPK